MIDGFGLGLRPEHYRDFAEGSPGAEWVEILSENYLVPGGKPLDFLDRIRARFPVVMHGVSLSIAGTEPLDDAYLRDLKMLARRAQPALISDHLCWTGVGSANLHDLMPIPFTREALNHVATRVGKVQDYLGRTLLLENVSTYLRSPSDEMAEWEFLAELVERSGCQLLLDVNNVFVNSVNHGFDARSFIDALPPAAVRQIHLAGHSEQGGHLIDTHDAPVCEAVWDLYEYSIARLGPIPTMIERDDHIPPLAELLSELDIARERSARAIARESSHAVAA